MPHSKKAPSPFTVGMAIFSMFFGSGNIVFPVLIGQASTSQSMFVFLGLLLTAVALPFFGLMSAALYDGSYIAFFNRLGKIPGWLAIGMIMALIGPFAVIPRCVIISFASFKVFFPDWSLITFSAISCFAIYLFTFKKSRILDVLGSLLTPFLLLSLVIIICFGLFAGVQMPQSDLSSSKAFLLGLVQGYNTMDIFAAFMFSGVVLSNMKEQYPHIEKDPKKMLRICFFSGSIGMIFLALIYWGMCFVAAYHGAEFYGVPKEELLARLTISILGSKAGVVVCLAVALACLTTAISLAMVFAEFLSQTVTKQKMNYKLSLMITLLISFLVSTMEFSGIQKILEPVLEITLPCMILLAVLNFLYKITGFKPVKLPVLGVFLISLWAFLSL